MSEMFNKEGVYDNEISPLMRKIIEICNENKIPMVASFTYENCEEKGCGRCTTQLVFEGREDEANQKATGIINNGGHTTTAFAVGLSS